MNDYGQNRFQEQIAVDGEIATAFLKCIKDSYKILKQQRINKRWSLNDRSAKRHHKQYFQGPNIPGFVRSYQYKHVCANDLFVSNFSGDNTYVRSKICLVKNILLKDQETCIVYLEFTNKESCSSNLFELNIIGIHTVSHLADQYSIH